MARTLAQRITATAAERGLTINGLAKELGIPQPRLREWAEGISYPSKRDYRRQVARLVGMTIAELDDEARRHAASKELDAAVVVVRAALADGRLDLKRLREPPG